MPKDRVRDLTPILEEARKIVGEAPPVGRIRWLFNFLDKVKIKRLSQKQKDLVGSCLMLLPPEDYHSSGLAYPVSEKFLLSVQAEIKRGLRDLFDDTVRSWEIPPPKSVSVYRMAPLGAKRSAFQFILHSRAWGNDLPAILWAVADLLKTNSRLIRACRTCRKPILRIKRQEYCPGSSCSRIQREKNRIDKRERARLLKYLDGKIRPNIVGPNGFISVERGKILRAYLEGIKPGQPLKDFWKNLSDPEGSKLSLYFKRHRP